MEQMNDRTVLVRRIRPIRAFQWTQEAEADPSSVPTWIEGCYMWSVKQGVLTLADGMGYTEEVTYGEWIVESPSGCLDIISPTTFSCTYEKVPQTEDERMEALIEKLIPHINTAIEKGLVRTRP